jgi:hypothetical protein
LLSSSINTQHQQQQQNEQPHQPTSNVGAATTATDTTTTESKLDIIENEIIQIEKMKESMKPELCTELITKLCCRLDSIDLNSNPNSFELKKKRKELIKRAESIDSTTDNIKNRKNEWNNPCSARSPPSTQPMSILLPTSKRTQADPVQQNTQPSAKFPSLSTSDILQMYSMGDNPSQVSTRLQQVGYVTEASIDLLNFESVTTPQSQSIQPTNFISTDPSPVTQQSIKTTPFVNQQPAAHPPAITPPSVPASVQSALLATEQATLPVATVLSQSFIEYSQLKEHPVQQNNHHDDHGPHQKAIARYSFSGDPQQKQISFPEGATISVYPKHVSGGWIRGKYEGHIGWLPLEYIVLQECNVHIQVGINHEMPQQQQQEIFVINMPTTIPPMEEVSDFETMTVMGGHAEHLNPRIASSNQNPWEVEQKFSANVKGENDFPTDKNDKSPAGKVSKKDKKKPSKKSKVSPDPKMKKENGSTTKLKTVTQDGAKKQDTASPTTQSTSESKERAEKIKSKNKKKSKKSKNEEGEEKKEA